jgi:hypothetical protein
MSAAYGVGDGVVVGVARVEELDGLIGPGEEPCPDEAIDGGAGPLLRDAGEPG